MGLVLDPATGQLTKGICERNSTGGCSVITISFPDSIAGKTATVTTGRRTGASLAHRVRCATLVIGGWGIADRNERSDGAGDAAGPVKCLRKTKHLPWLDFVGIAQLIFVELENLHVCVRAAEVLLRDLTQGISRFHCVCPARGCGCAR